MPPEHVVTNATLVMHLGRVASRRERAIVFTTTLLPADADHRFAELAMLQNFCWWLDRAGTLSHTLLLTTDNATWHALAAHGMPVVLDRAFPLRHEFSEPGGGAPGTPNRVFDVASECCVHT